MATNLSDYDMKIFAKRVTMFYWADVVVNDDYLTPEYILFCMKAAQAGISATAKIKFFETIWESSFPEKINSIADIRNMITTAVSDSIESYNHGQISALAKAGMLNTISTQTIKGYFQYGPDVVPCPDIKI